MRSLALAVGDFCGEHVRADAIQVTALEGDLVRDVGEFRSDWGPERADGIVEWAEDARAERVTLQALRRTGRHLPDGEVWEQVGAVLEIPLR